MIRGPECVTTAILAFVETQCRPVKEQLVPRRRMISDYQEIGHISSCLSKLLEHTDIYEIVIMFTDEA